jgi:hypothetical protein
MSSREKTKHNIGWPYEVCNELRNVITKVMLDGQPETGKDRSACSTLNSGELYRLVFLNCLWSS